MDVCYAKYFYYISVENPLNFLGKYRELTI